MTTSSPTVLRVEADRAGNLNVSQAARSFVDSVVSRMRETLDLTTAAFWLTPYREQGAQFLSMHWRDAKAAGLSLGFTVIGDAAEPREDDGLVRATVHDMTDALLLARLIADEAVANAWGRI